MEDLKSMSKQQLEEELEKVEAFLEDLIEERDFTLSQTGVHIGAARAAALRSEWDRDEKKYRERIAAIRSLLETGALVGG